MPSHVTYSAMIIAREMVTSGVVGQPSVTVPHDMGYRVTHSVQNIWSSSVTVPVGPLVIIDLQALPLVHSSTPKDLFTGQGLHLFRLRHVSGGVAIAQVKTEENDVLLTFTMGPEVDIQAKKETGHLFAQPVKTIEFFALTGDTNVELLVGTHMVAQEAAAHGESSQDQAFSGASDAGSAPESTEHA